MLNSSLFPYATFDNIVKAIEEINKNYPNKFKRENHKLTRA